MFVVIESDKYDGSTAPYAPTHPNLSCYVEVWEYDRIEDNETKLVTLNVPYDHYTKRATLDISGLVDLKPGVPSPTISHGHSTTASTAIFFKFADQWGTPLLPGDLSRSDNGEKYFNIIHGSALQYLKDYTNNNGIPLFSYKNFDGTYRQKKLTKTQPEWLYFYPTGGGELTLNIQQTIIFADGTTFTSDQDITAQGSQVNWISVSYDDVAAAATKEVASYNITVRKAADPSGFFTIAQQSFILDECTDNDKYLCIDNGLGGIETVRMPGESSEDFQVTNEEFTQADWGAASVRSFHNARGVQIYKFASGYMTEAEAYHLRQLLMAQTWYYYRGDFVSILPTTSEIKDVKNTEAFLFFVEMNYEGTEYLKSANTVHIKQ